MNLLEQMKQYNPNRNPIFTAIDKLKDPKDIQRFMREYEDFMVRCSEPSTKGKEIESARANVGYILGYYGDDVKKLWYGSLKNVSHPFYGESYGRE